MFDAEELAEDGFDLDNIVHCLEHAPQGVNGMKSKEAQVVRNIIQGMIDEAESY